MNTKLWLLFAAGVLYAARPEISHVTECVDAGSTMILTGEGFSPAAEVWLWQPGEDKIENVRPSAFQAAQWPDIPPAGAQKARTPGTPTARAIAAVQLGYGPATSDRVRPTMAWVKTVEGFSKPYYFNVPELWFVSDPEIVSGQRLRLFGRNLAPGDGRTNGARYNYAVAFRHTGSGTIYWAQVLDSTTQDRADFKPYHLQVKVPENLAAGDYEVRVHALYGGAAGWSNSLAVRAVTGHDFVGVMSRPADHSLVTPAGNGKPPAVFEVPGLRGDGVTDNSDAIQRAIGRAAAQGGGLVALPPGNLAISRTIHVLPHVVLEGSGRAATQLVVSPFRPMTGGLPIPADKLFQSPRGAKGGVGDYTPFTKNDTPMVWLDNKSGLQDLSLIAGGAANTAVLVGTADPNLIVTDTFLHRTEIRNRIQITYIPGNNMASTTGGIHVVSPTRGFRMTDNLVEASSPLIVRTTWMTHHYMLLDGNVFRNVPTNDYESVFLGNLADSIVTDNEFVDGRRALMNQRGWSRNWFKGNVIHNISGGDNGTEIMMSETPGVSWKGKVVGADGIRMTVDFETGLAKDQINEYGRQPYAYVVSGRGAGQFRRVTGNDGKSLSIDTPWRVTPDATSQVNILNGTAQNLFVANRVFDTRGPVQFSYGNMLDCIIAGNEMYDATDINLFAFSRPADNGFNPNAYNLIVDNRMVNSGGIFLIGILMHEKAKPEDLLYEFGPMFANTVRRNQVWSPAVPPNANQYYNVWWRTKTYGIDYAPSKIGGVNVSHGSWNIVESNFIYKNQAGITITGGENNVVRDNRIDLVNQPFNDVDSKATVFEPGPSEKQK